MQSQSPLNSLDQSLLQSVFPYGLQSACAKGEQLLDMGEDADCFFYVLEGTFEISYRSKKTSIVVALIGPGNFIGEIGFFDQLTRTRTIIAIEDTKVLLFDRAAMIQLAEEQPVIYGRLLEYLLRSVCGRFRQILADRGPLTAYAASLSTGREHFKGLEQLPADMLGSSGWVRINREMEEFKARMFDASYRLQQEKDSPVSPALQQEIIGILDDFNIKVAEFGPLIQDSDAADLIWGYIFKEAFPYLMRSRFFERAYYKPKGYAGDFFMIELIYRQQPEGDGKLGRIIDQWCLDQVPARAVRSRRLLLSDTLDRMCRERLSLDRPINIMNLACGPSRELFDLIADGVYDDRINALCVDIDSEALQYANEQVNTFPHRANIRFMNENVIKWAIGRIKHEFEPQDIIYSSGLCDYLDHRLLLALINRCYKQLNPGGELIIGNFSPTNPDRLFMDHLMYWRLIYRDQEALSAVFNESLFGGVHAILVEDEGVNLFAVAKRGADQRG